MVPGQRAARRALRAFVAGSALFACAQSTTGGMARDVAPALAMSSQPLSQPKYPAHALPLSRERAFLQRAPAPDFWALVPYYVGQEGDSACSAASLAMLVNAARLGRALDSETPLVSQAALRARVGSALWERGLAAGGEGVTLEQLAALASESLRAVGIEARLDVTHVTTTSADALERWRAVLRENELSSAGFVLVNFLASVYVGVGDYGHIAPVGAYDAEQRRVLVMDPDRTWYEPYWIPDEVALAGMATEDALASAARGYLVVTPCEGACAPP